LKKPADALRESIRWLEEMVLSFSQQRTTDHLLITGDSIWVKSVVRLLYGRPLASLAQRGIFIKPLTFEQMPAFKKENEIAKVVFVTDQGPHRADFNVGQFSSIIHRVSGDDSTEVRLFPWALIARE
ncbi:hypothetical protein JZU71_04145, partial [bacterium]|nr:hypothetical protein [bacterium]